MLLIFFTYSFGSFFLNSPGFEHDVLTHVAKRALTSKICLIFRFNLICDSEKLGLSFSGRGWCILNRSFQAQLVFHGIASSKLRYLQIFAMIPNYAVIFVYHTEGPPHPWTCSACGLKIPLVTLPSSVVHTIDSHSLLMYELLLVFSGVQCFLKVTILEVHKFVRGWRQRDNMSSSWTIQPVIKFHTKKRTIKCKCTQKTEHRQPTKDFISQNKNYRLNPGPSGIVAGGGVRPLETNASGWLLVESYQHLHCNLTRWHRWLHLR